MYEREERLRDLREQGEEDWAKMQQEFNSSESDDDKENYIWYKDGDPNTYFSLCTKHKNII